MVGNRNDPDATPLDPRPDQIKLPNPALPRSSGYVVTVRPRGTPTCLSDLPPFHVRCMPPILPRSVCQTADGTSDGRSSPTRRWVRNPPRSRACVLSSNRVCHPPQAASTTTRFLHSHPSSQAGIIHQSVPYTPHHIIHPPHPPHPPIHPPSSQRGPRRRRRLSPNQTLGQERPDSPDQRQGQRYQHDGDGKGAFAGRQLVAEELEVEGEGETGIVC